MENAKIGETFKELGKTFRVVQSHKADCDKCAFYGIRCSTTQDCTPDFREDGQYVIFKEVKDGEIKIGETFEYKGRLLRAVEGDMDDCCKCAFYNDIYECKEFPCIPNCRHDGRIVHYEEVKDE